MAGSFKSTVWDYYFTHRCARSLIFFNELKPDKSGRKKPNEEFDVALTSKQLHEFKEKIRRNPRIDNCQGVPQGSSISAVLANVYMEKADKEINDLVKACDGFYMRYSDDFIIVLPGNIEDACSEINSIKSIIEKVKVNLQSEKTKIYEKPGRVFITQKPI